MLRPSIIFIDWYQTISWSKFWDGWRDESHALHQQFSTAQAWLFKEQRELVNAWMRGQETSQTVCSLLAKQSGISYTTLLSELEDSCTKTVMTPGVIEEIQRLRTLDTPVLLITDNMDAFARWTIPALGLQNLFDEIFSSHQTGLLKDERNAQGEPTLFAQILARRQLGWSGALLIDDCADRHADMSARGLRLAIPKSPQDTIQILKSIR